MFRLRESLTTRGAAFLAAGVVLCLAGLLLGHFDLTRVGVALSALPLLASLIGRRHNLVFDVTRQVTPSRIHMGHIATVQVTLRNTQGSRSPQLFAQERFSPVLGDYPQCVLPALAPDAVTHMEYAVRARIRGAHRLGPIAVRVQDPFGLTSRRSTLGSSDEMLVLPQIVNLSDGRALSRGLGSEGSVPHRVALHGEDDQSIREYRDGDDLRRIHWPATARTNQLMVRQEDRPAKRRAVILLDTRAVAHGGSGPHSSSEWAVTMAASAMTHLMSQGFAVHVLTLDPSRESGVREDTDYDATLERLARVGLEPSDDLSPLLHAASSATASGGLVFAIVGPMDDGASRALSSLRQPGAPGLCAVVDPTDFGRSQRSSSSPLHVDPGFVVTTLEGAGWSVLQVGGTTFVADVWSALIGPRAVVSA